MGRLFRANSRSRRHWVIWSHTATSIPSSVCLQTERCFPHSSSHLPCLCKIRWLQAAEYNTHAPTRTALYSESAAENVLSEQLAERQWTLWLLRVSLNIPIEHKMATPSKRQPITNNIIMRLYPFSCCNFLDRASTPICHATFSEVVKPNCSLAPPNLQSPHPDFHPPRITFVFILCLHKQVSWRLPLKWLQ